MKKILLTTVAMSVLAPAAFAFTAKQALNDALGQINDAYQAVGQAAPDATVEAIADLMYYVDNHNAVESITLSSSSDPDADASEAVDEYYLNITKFNNTTQIASAKSALVNAITDDMFGEDKTADDIAISETDDVWAETGVDGFAGAYIDAQTIAKLNALETAISDAVTADFDADSLAAIETAANNVETAAVNVSNALTDIATAHGTAVNSVEDTELRSVVEGDVTIGDNKYRAHVELTDTFDYGTLEDVTYESVVDAYVD